MGAAAVRLAEEIGYDSVGTVEFLLDADRDEFFFLEMNTRLQVEHRVTERVTGFDLVDLQLRAATGEEFDFEQGEIDVEGHAIEARLVAEDPAEDWRPSTGTLHRFLAPSTDFGVSCDVALPPSGGEVSVHYDSLLAKVIAYGSERNEAIGLLAQALARAPIHGLRTNRDHLLAVLGSDDFRAGNTTTAFVDLHLTLLDAGPSDDEVHRHVLAAVLWSQQRRRAADPHWPAASSGWRNVGEPAQHVRVRVDERELDVIYRVCDGARFEATVGSRRLTGSWSDTDEPDALLVEVDGVAAIHRLHEVGNTVYVNSPIAQSAVVELPRFPVPQAAASAGGLVAPVPGRVVAVEIEPGDTVTVGQTLVVMEAMKVEHRIAAPADGKVVEVLVAVGDNVDAHQVLLQMDLT